MGREFNRREPDVPGAPHLRHIRQTVTLAEFTDGGGASGTFALTNGTVPIGSVVTACFLEALVGFSGGTATIIVGDGSDTDRYMTGTPDVASTLANGLDLGVPSGAKYHSAAKTVTITIAETTDFGTIAAGSLRIVVEYLEP